MVSILPIRFAAMGFAAMALAAQALAAKAAPFKHPAILSDTEELVFIKGRIKAGAQPWTSALEKARTSNYASLAWAPKARDTVACGANSNPNQGCNEETDDAIAAYTHALLWYFTDNAAHARKAVQILDAWSGRLKAHTLHNAPLQASWAAGQFAKAAELIRYTFPEWGAADIAAFSGMLNRAFLPLLVHGHSFANGNWELCFTDAIMSIGVFNDDTAAFNRGLFLLRKRIPAFFYLASDGRMPVRPHQTGKGLYGTNTFSTDSAMNAFWHRPGMYFDGLCQETCRDLGHTQLGLAALSNAAEIAYHQGIDVFGEFSRRITAAMEVHAGLMLGNPWPKGLCRDTLRFIHRDTWEIAYNHYHGRMGMDLPMTKAFIETKVRPSATHLPMAWETLTHAGLGKVGMPTGVRPDSRKGGKAGNTKVSLGRFIDSRPLIRKENPAGSGLYSPDGSWMGLLP